MRSRKGFTLVELLVVIIIVGVLASVAIPLMSGYVNRAKKTEAIAALGTIRSAERAYFAENGKYLAITTPATDWGGTAGNALGIGKTDLDGKYYNNTCYTVDATNNTINAAAGASSAAACGMNMDGTIYNGG